MTEIIYLLTACNIALPLVAALRWCVSRKGVEINHIFMFTVGFLFYWIAPVIIGLNRHFETDAQISGWSMYFNSIPPEMLAAYLVFALGFYGCFLLGSVWGSRIQFEIGSSLLRDTDAHALSSLAHAMKQSANSLSATLISLLPSRARTQWDAWDGRGEADDTLLQSLYAVVNGWIQGGSINAALGEGLPLSPATRAALTQHRMQADAGQPYAEAPSVRGAHQGRRLRRVIMQEAFPSWIAPRLRFGSRWEALRIHPEMLRPHLLLGATLAAIYAFINRNDLFKGYTSASVYDNPGPRGTLVATSLILLAIGLLYTLYNERIRPRLAPARRLLNPYMGAYFATAILVMSMGGRLYVVSGACMLMIYVTVYHRRFSLRNFVFVGGGLFLLAAAVGSARLGGGLSLTELLTGVFAESIGASISLISFLGSGRMELLNAPQLLMYDFLNLIPSALLPDKGLLMRTPADLGYVIYAPLGAQHSATSFLMNFGMLGSMGVIFLAGVGVSQLKRSRVPLIRVMYIMIAGWMGFTLFRDPFSISLVKTILEFSILIPILTVYSARLLQSWMRPVGALLSIKTHGAA